MGANCPCSVNLTPFQYNCTHQPPPPNQPVTKTQITNLILQNASLLVLWSSCCCTQTITSLKHAVPAHSTAAARPFGAQTATAATHMLRERSTTANSPTAAQFSHSSAVRRRGGRPAGTQPTAAGCPGCTAGGLHASRGRQAAVVQQALCAGPAHRRLD